MMDWNDRSTCVLFGDGAGAALVKVDSDFGILGISQGSDGAKGQALTCENRRINNPYMKNSTDLSYTNMNGQEVYKFAVRTVPKAILEALGRQGLLFQILICLFFTRQTSVLSNLWQSALRSPWKNFPRIYRSAVIFPREAYLFFWMKLTEREG